EVNSFRIQTQLIGIHDSARQQQRVELRWICRFKWNINCYRLSPPLYVPSADFSFLRRNYFRFSSSLVKSFSRLDYLNLLKSLVHEDCNFFSIQVFFGHETPPGLSILDGRRSAWSSRTLISNGPGSTFERVFQKSGNLRFAQASAKSRCLQVIDRT